MGILDPNIIIDIFERKRENNDSALKANNVEQKIRAGNGIFSLSESQKAVTCLFNMTIHFPIDLA